MLNPHNAEPPPAGSGCLWVGVFLQIEERAKLPNKVLTFQKQGKPLTLSV